METRKCRITGKSFNITDRDRDFYDKISPVIGDEKFTIPFPTLCPEERLRRRLQWKNYITLHKRTSDFSGNPLVSMHPADSKLTVYSQPEWWSDVWDPMSYGRDFDFSRSFMEQFVELIRTVPH